MFRACQCSNAKDLDPSLDSGQALNLELYSSRLAPETSPLERTSENPR